MSVDKLDYYYDDEIEALIALLTQKDDFSVVGSSPSAKEPSWIKRKRMKREKKEQTERNKVRAEKLKEKKRDKLMRKLRMRCLVGESKVGAIDNRHGVQLTSREITSIAERSMYTGDHDASDATIKETSWDLARLVERPTLVTSFSWFNNDEFFKARFAIPSDLLSIELAKIPFNSFQYWRGDVVLRLQVAGSPMVQGIICMTMIPLVDVPTLDSMQWDISSLTINPTVYLYANTNTSAELRIPYNHYQSYLSTNFSNPVGLDQNLGYVVIWILSPLRAATVTSVTCSLFSMLENSEFKVPRISSDVVGLRGESGFFSSALSSIMDVGSSIISPVVEDLGTVGKSRMKQISKKGTKELVDDVSSKALPSNFIGDAIDMVGNTLNGMLGFLGLDNPTIPSEENRSIVKSNGSMNYSVGPEYIEKLSIMPSALSLVTPETFATVTDEMDVEYLYRRYSYCGSFTFNSTATPSTVVHTIPLSPFPTFTDGSQATLVGAGTIVQDAVWFPLLSYLGLPYRYWTGGLKYKLLVSCSSLQTCKLYAAFNYGRYTAPSSLLDAASQYGHAIEISQGSNEFEFAVPYIATQPYLEVTTGATNSLNSMGMLNFVVLNSLVSPPSVTDTINISIFICGSDDFSYEFIADNNPAYAVFRKVVNPFTSSMINEAAGPLYVPPPGEHLIVNRGECLAFKNCKYCGNLLHSCTCLRGESMLSAQTVAPTNIDSTVTDTAVGDQNEDDDQIAPPQVDAVVDDHFGIVGISLRNLAKKYQLVGQWALQNVPTSISAGWSMAKIRIPYDLFCLSEYVAATPITTPLPASRSSGLLAWMAGMYRQFKGGLRFKIIFNTSGIGATPTPFPFISAYVTFKPGSDRPNNNVLTIDEMIGQVPASSTGTVTNNSFTYPVNSTPRLAVLNGNVSNVLEFEVPYNSKYLSTLVPADNLTPFTNALTQFVGLGNLYIVASSPSTQNITAQVYVAFADESRFGTLYRVPLVYAPAVYTQSGNVYNPSSNFGSGTYYLAPAPPPPGNSDHNFELVGESKPGDGKLDWAAAYSIGAEIGNEDAAEVDDQVTELAGKIETQASIKSTPPVIPSNPQTGTGRVRSLMNRGRNKDKFGSYDQWVKSKVRNFVRSNGGVTSVELGKYMRYLTNNNKSQQLFMGGSYTKMIKAVGLRQARNGKFYVDPWPKRGQRNRYPVRGRTSITTAT